MIIFGIHICHEEIFAVAASIPMVKFVVPWCRAKWHKLRGTCPHDKEQIKTQEKQNVH